MSRMRRLDIEEILGSIPMPEVDGVHLVEILFKVGPVKAETSISEADLEPYERRRGIELAPWQADLLVRMSQAYLSEMHAAQKHDAPPPWPEAVKMWQYVRNSVAERSWDKLEKREPSNGSRKRHRNPPSG